MNELLLTPDESNPGMLSILYSKAMNNAVELYIASAYLTLWGKRKKVGKKCQHVTFLVGTDFGLSRKKAMLDVLKWLPKHGSTNFRAVDGISRAGFHPKIMAWRTGNNEHFALLGSSNLSKAAFSQNYEANIIVKISSVQYKDIKNWLDPLLEKSALITKEWINSEYDEAEVHKIKRRRPVTAKLKLPSNAAYKQAVRIRRKKQDAFREIQGRLLKDARKCAAQTLDDKAFWRSFWEVWSNHDSRFQGNGIQITGSRARWSQACQALLLILNVAKTGPRLEELDGVVCKEIDKLKRLGNPARRAWLSEMLCHSLPEFYPVWNSPVTKWLRFKKWTGRRGLSEGNRYIELANLLRQISASKPAGVRNLAELDGLIWLRAEALGLLKKGKG
jgi:hypothetical protein